MAFQPVDRTVQIQLFGREDGQTTINDLYFYHGPSDPTVTEVAALLDAICEWYAGSIASYASDTWSFVLGKARLLTSAAGFVLANALHGAGGGVGGGVAPNNVSFAVSFRTAVGGRGGRGRNYVPGIPNQALSGNIITSDFITNYINAYSALLPAGATVPDPWAWVIVHRFENGVPLAAGLPIVVEAVVATDNVVDSQRRRLPGRGV